MPPDFFSLPEADRREVLELASHKTGRPVRLIENDVWVVWALQVLFESPLADRLVFKGGTTLSKVYKVTGRLSRDLDLTCDIRKIVPELQIDTELPASRSQAKKWTDAIRAKLPDWIATDVVPRLVEALQELPFDVEVGHEIDTVTLRYPGLAEKARAQSAQAPLVLLEFGARSTGEPAGPSQVECDLAGMFDDVKFPVASPRVMSVHRTFWEKATAIHVYCLREGWRGNTIGWSRHWHDIARIWHSEFGRPAIEDLAVARQVVRHKSRFFIEKDSHGNVVDYQAVQRGGLRLVPSAPALEALGEDHQASTIKTLPPNEVGTFDALVARCSELEQTINELYRQA